MRGFLIFSVTLNFLVISNCINVPRDNIYDSKNPDKASLKGILYEPDSIPVNDVIVYLLHNEKRTYTDTTNTQGGYYFERIDPGIYTMLAQTKYYAEIGATESLWAGIHIPNYNLFFTTLHFDDETQGQIPYGFNVISGEWNIIKDSSPGHSLPNVYNGINHFDNQFSLSLFRSPGTCYDFGMRFKILDSATLQWETGMVLWYQNNKNFYFVRVNGARIIFGSMEDSAETQIHHRNISLPSNTWCTLQVMRYDTQIRFLLNGESAFLFSVSDIQFSDGFWGIYVVNNDSTGVVSVVFDDIYVKPSP